MSSTSDDELDLLTPSKRRRLAAPCSDDGNKKRSSVSSPGATISRRSGRAIRKPKAFDEGSSSSSDRDDVSGIAEDESEEEEERRRPRRGGQGSKAQSDHDDDDEGEQDGRRRPKRKITASTMRSPVLLSKASQPRSSQSQSRASATPKTRTPTSAAKEQRLPRKRYSSPVPQPEVAIAGSSNVKGKRRAADSSIPKKGRMPAHTKEEANTPSETLPGDLLTSADDDQPSFIKPTSADAYFSIHAAKTAARKARDQTSSNLITSKWPSLSSTAISRFSKALADGSIPGHGADLALRPSSYRPLWDKWLALASSNHSVAFYGVGSMRAPLEAFLTSVAQRGIAGAVVLRGEMGGRIEEAMTACERYAGISAPLDAGAGRKAGASALARAQRIADAFGAREGSGESAPRRLFLLIYDLAAPHLLSTRSQTLLGILSKARNLHLLGTVSHISADSLAGMAGSASPRWVWQDLTTFATPLDEMLVTRHGGGGLARLAGLPKPLSLSSGVVTTSTSLATTMDEDGGLEATARGTTGGDGGPAGPVLKSVTSRSRKVFMLVAQYQLEALSDRASQGTIKPETLAMPYSKLKEQAARTAFINDMTMRSLLGEHLEHEFIRVAIPSPSGAMETWNGFAGVGAGGEASQGQSQAVPGNQSHSYRAIPEHASLYLALSPDEIRSAVALCKRLPQH